MSLSHEMQFHPCFAALTHSHPWKMPMTRTIVLKYSVLLSM